MNNETPSKWMYTFVILVFIVGATFILCHTDYKEMQLDKELKGKSETEQVQTLKEQIKRLNPHVQERDLDEITSKEKLISSREYELRQDSNGLVTVLVMAFFVMIAVCIAIFKYVAIAVLGLKSLKNIRRNI
jgi:uncharacterized membrane protein (DUF106 family)